MKFEFKNYCELLIRGDRSGHLIASVLYRRSGEHVLGVFFKEPMKSLAYFVVNGDVLTSVDRDELPLRQGDREQLYELERVHSDLVERKEGADEIVISREATIMENYARARHIKNFWEYSSEGFDERIRGALLNDEPI